jgi:adenylate cyclase
MLALSFDEKVSLEVLRLEKLRSRILTGIFVFGVVIQLAFFLINMKGILGNPIGKNVFLVSIAFNLGASIYGILHLLYLNRIPRKRKFNLTNYGRIMHTTVEALFPAFLLYFISTSFVEPANVLDSPSFYLYFPIIILSILRLNFFYSAMTGFVSAAAYVTLGFIILSHSEISPAVRPIGPPPMVSVFSKAFMLILCGVVAGFIGNQVSTTIKKMVKAMQDESRIHNLFSQQTSKEVVDEILATGNKEESKMMNVCVMFIDIRNFTTMVGQKTAAEIVNYQNTFFSIVIESVYKNKGVINQFLGDGCMVTFGAPQPIENPCQEAVNTAYEIRNEVEKKMAGGLLPFTNVGIGMHVGDAVTGNIGNEVRQQYSITGSVVIQAFRIEKLNKDFGSQILASEDVIDKVTHFEKSPEPMGQVTIKGWDEPIMIYRLA